MYIDRFWHVDMHTVNMETCGIPVYHRKDVLSFSHVENIYFDK